MPGELITADWQVQLGDLLMGDGCTWDNDTPGWTFFGLPVTDQDMAMSLVDGERATSDFNGARLVTGALTTAFANLSTADAFTAAAALEVAFGANEDMELHFRLPGIGHQYVTGRPRGAVIDLSQVSVGVVTALVAFKAHNPAREVYSA